MWWETVGVFSCSFMVVLLVVLAKRSMQCPGVAINTLTKFVA